MIQYQTTLTADNSDVFQGTDLQSAPEAGYLALYLASTQNDTEITFSAAANVPARLIKAVLRSNGMPLLSDDIPYVIPMGPGAKPVLNVNIVTAATVGVFAMFVGISDLAT